MILFNIYLYKDMYNSGNNNAREQQSKKVQAEKGVDRMTLLAAKG